ncbi:MAG: DsbA family protein [Patescibacteria group bacterium]|jgi:protein-disulfide isomerase
MDEQEQQLTKKQRKELRRQERHDEASRGKTKRKFTTLIIVSVVGIGVIVGIWALAKSAGTTPTALTPDNDPFVGSADAKVVVTEYSDFQCPACQSAQPIVKQVIEKYGDRIKFVYNNFPLPMHANADEAARAAECAFDQNKFWEFHDKLFGSQSDWEDLSNPADKFSEYAGALGLDTAAYAVCYDGSDAKDRVNYDTREAQARKVNSTPTFFVNDQKIVGAQPLEQFSEAIDAELAKSQ